MARWGKGDPKVVTNLLAWTLLVTSPDGSTDFW